MTNTPALRDDRAAVDKAIGLLSSFGDQASSGLGVSELARRSELSKSTAFRLLGMLERNGVVEKIGCTYRFGQLLHELGTQTYAAEQDRIREVLTPYVADLYEMTHEIVHLAALHGTDVVYLAKLYGHHRVPSPSRVGGIVPAHCTAVGKALLAHTPDSFRAVTETRVLRAVTGNTITDGALLADQLVRIRREGIAFENDEAAAGLSCVAVPVFGASGRAVAALSVSGASATFKASAHAAALRRVGNAASGALQRAMVGATVRRLRATA